MMNRKMNKMNLFSIINDQFESQCSQSELEGARVIVTPDEINQIIEIAHIPLPDMLHSFFKEGVIYSLVIKGTSIIIAFCYVQDLINVKDNYPYFKEDIHEGLIFATDLGDDIYYYGNGREGMGLYVVEAGAGNYYEEAIKFANTFEDFFVDGKGIETLKKNFNV